MRKRHVIALAGLFVLCLAAVGCGKDKEEKTDDSAQVTVAPVEENGKSDSNLVDMQKVEDEPQEEKVIGTKSATASKLEITNKTGDEVSYLYIRPHNEEFDDEEWGDELIKGAFTLKNGDTAVYYFEKGASSALYDIRITYTDEDKNECFFRKLPLNTISRISLCMDGVGEDSIPYARYFSGTNKKETSTLNEVKRRLGISTDDSEEDSDEEDSADNNTNSTNPTSAPEPTSSPAQPTAAPEPTSAPVEEPDPGDEKPAAVTAAEDCIGQSLDELFNSCGDPVGSDVQDEPESGKTGYYYYDGFTVSTMFDEDGNEVVAGVW